MNSLLNSTNHEEKYQFSTLIGKGSFGKVYLAKEIETNMNYAIKVVEKSGGREEDVLFIETEAQIMKAMKHPHIVKFKDHFHTGTKIYLVMEYLEGGSLLDFFELIQAGKQKLCDEEASTLMKRVISAVKYMHLKGFVHRDIKPENILFGKPGDLSSVKLADFGLCREVSPFSKTFYQGCGTPMYIAPEFLIHGVYTKKVDIWGCGIILFMLCNQGKHPFYDEGDTKETLFEKIKSPVKHLPANFNHLAKDLFLKMTMIEPSERYSIELIEKHPWITREEKAVIPLTFIESLKAFSFQNKIINVILATMIAKYIQLHGQCKSSLKNSKISLNRKEEILLSKLNFLNSITAAQDTPKSECLTQSPAVENTEKHQEDTIRQKINFADLPRQFRIKENKLKNSSTTNSPHGKRSSAFSRLNSFSNAVSNSSNSSSSCISPGKKNIKLFRIGSINVESNQAFTGLEKSSVDDWEEKEREALPPPLRRINKMPGSKQCSINKTPYDLKKKRSSLEVPGSMSMKEENSSVILNTFFSPTKNGNQLRTNNIIDLKGYLSKLGDRASDKNMGKRESCYNLSQFSSKKGSGLNSFGEALAGTLPPIKAKGSKPMK